MQAFAHLGDHLIGCQRPAVLAVPATALLLWCLISAALVFCFVPAKVGAPSYRLESRLYLFPGCRLANCVLTHSLAHSF